MKKLIIVFVLVLFSVGALSCESENGGAVGGDGVTLAKVVELKAAVEALQEQLTEKIKQNTYLTTELEEERATIRRISGYRCPCRHEGGGMDM